MKMNYLKVKNQNNKKNYNKLLNKILIYRIIYLNQNKKKTVTMKIKLIL